MGFVDMVRSSYGALRVLAWMSGFLNLFCRRFDRRRNCAVRAAAALPPGLLNGQDLPPLADLPYGAWTMGSNGCEVIAAYNALLALGQPEPLPEVAAELEKTGLLFNGFGGTNLAALPKFFRRRGVHPVILRRRDREIYDTAMAACGCGILAYWTGAGLRRADGSWHTLHTVSVHRQGSGALVCNARGDRATPVTAPSLAEFLRQQGASPVCLVALKC